MAVNTIYDGLHAIGNSQLPIYYVPDLLIRVE